MPNIKKAGPAVWLAAAACLILVALVCAGLFRSGSPVPPEPSGPSAGSSPAPQETPTPGSDTPAPTEEPAPADETAPRLLGVRDLTVELNGTVSYRDGVSAVDDVDGAVSVQIDTKAVDLTAAGEYPVIYSARDAAGNRTEQTITVTVVEPDPPEEPDPAEPTPSEAPAVTQEAVDLLCDQILAQILRDGMSQREQALAIFNYVNRNVTYVETADKSSWMAGAHLGFTRHRGDCFNYFSCSKALLTRAGIPNVDLQRVGGNSDHYWQLVNTGDGWYHFDTCPHPQGHPLVSFMLTEAQVRDYSEEVKDVSRSYYRNYYTYDYEACPVQVEGTPEEPAPSESPAEPSESPAEPSESPAEPSGSPAEPSQSPAEPSESPAEPSASPVEPSEAPAEQPEDPENPEEREGQMYVPGWGYVDVFQPSDDFVPVPDYSDEQAQWDYEHGQDAGGF